MGYSIPFTDSSLYESLTKVNGVYESLESVTQSVRHGTYKQVPNHSESGIMSPELCGAASFYELVGRASEKPVNRGSCMSLECVSCELEQSRCFSHGANTAISLIHLRNCS